MRFYGFDVMLRGAARLLLLLLPLTAFAQGWPSAYDGVMLQGFYWDSYRDTQWSRLESEADELSRYFDLIWVPQSGLCSTSRQMMGYTPVYYFNQNSSFGTERQLRSMIAAFRQRGTGIIADVVINHRENLGSGGSWVDYPAETYRGETYRMRSTDVCADDDGGATAAWASGAGVSLSQAKDTGEDWPGCRDLDHTSANVQRCVKAYLDFLLHDIGYTGFRYDMTRGFWASFIADYNMSARPQFSVGEYWEGTDAIRQWIDYSKGYVSDAPTSAAFDFQFRYRVRDAINQGDWRQLGSNDMVMKQDYYKQYAVTFVENHDTERRTNAEQDPIRSDTLQANAFLLAMPGTPCVFLRHWQDCKPQIKAMIEARRLAGITNTSTWTQKASTASYYAVAVKGTRGELVAVVGKKGAVKATTPYLPKSYIELFSGPGYRYLLSSDANTVWMDQPSGAYDAALQVRLTGVTARADARIVYTLDGTDPTPSSPAVQPGATLVLDASCTLRAGLLLDGKVTGITQRTYEVTPFVPHTAIVYVRNENTWTRTNFYVWDNSDRQLCGNWPGKAVTQRVRVDGQTWYTQSFDIPEPGYSISLVVSSGTSGSPQTVDVTGITSDRYLLVTKDRIGDKYAVMDVTQDVLTALPPVTASHGRSSSARYDLQGRPAPSPRPGQICVEGDRKVLY